MPQLRGGAPLLTVRKLTLLGFMLIDYDNGLMGGLVNAPVSQDTFDNPSANMSIPSLQYLRVCYRLQQLERRLTSSEVSYILGAIITAPVGEKLGCRKSVGIGAVISMIGVILQAITFGRAHLIVGRIMSGVGLGFINSTMPVWQA
jgi:MFS family permease